LTKADRYRNYPSPRENDSSKQLYGKVKKAYNFESKFLIVFFIQIGGKEEAYNYKENLANKYRHINKFMAENIDKINTHMKELKKQVKVIPDPLLKPVSGNIEAVYQEIWWTLFDGSAMRNECHSSGYRFINQCGLLDFLTVDTLWSYTGP